MQHDGRTKLFKSVYHDIVLAPTRITVEICSCYICPVDTGQMGWWVTCISWYLHHKLSSQNHLFNDPPVKAFAVYHIMCSNGIWIYNYKIIEYNQSVKYLNIIVNIRTCPTLHFCKWSRGPKARYQCWLLASLLILYTCRLKFYLALLTSKWLLE